MPENDSDNSVTAVSGQPHSLDQIDQHWQAVDTATLLFVRKDDSILLIRKKRGLGEGKINGPGGKQNEGESVHTAMEYNTLNQGELELTEKEYNSRNQGDSEHIHMEYNTKTKVNHYTLSWSIIHETEVNYSSQTLSTIQETKINHCSQT